MISLQSITKTYPLSKENVVHAVCDVSLEIGQSEFVVITGRSGSGKTTLLNLIAGLTRPTSGSVIFEGTDLWSLPDKTQSALRNQKFGFVFQFPSLLPTLTTLENVVLPSVFSRNDKRNGVVSRAEQLLDTVGLSEKLNAYPRQLSAGQQQRVVIARSLLHQPDLLLADEPTSNLDEQTEQEIMQLFKQIHGETGVTVVMVTHTNQLVSYGTRWVKMASGRIET